MHKALGSNPSMRKKKRKKVRGKKKEREGGRQKRRRKSKRKLEKKYFYFLKLAHDHIITGKVLRGPTIYLSFCLSK
jgi:hypothetical protein